MLALHLLRELQSFHAFTSILTEHYKLLCDGINCLQPFNKALMSEVYECGGMCITYMMWFSVTTTCDALYSTDITSVSFERCIVHDLAFSRNSVVILHKNYTAQTTCMLKSRSCLCTSLTFAEHIFHENPWNTQHLNGTEVDSTPSLHYVITTFLSPWLALPPSPCPSPLQPRETSPSCRTRIWGRSFTPCTRGSALLWLPSTPRTAPPPG